MKATFILRPRGKDALQIILRSSIGSLGKRENELVPRSWYAEYRSASVKRANPPKEQACLSAAIVMMARFLLGIPGSLL
jgi:hypothetical protein